MRCLPRYYNRRPVYLRPTVNPDSIRAYLQSYRRRTTLADASRVLQDGETPPDSVRDLQRQTLGEPDDHVIPTSEYEYRVDGRDGQMDNKPGFIAFQDEIGLVESAWDTLVAKGGMETVSTYRPFHDDIATSGIYISQRGLRYLGHLLYHWSRVHAHADSQAEYTEALLTNRLAHDSKVFAGDPAFDRVEDALAMARELFVRYQWFHHQFELVVAYIEDARDEQLYQEYAEERGQTAAEQGRGLSAALALSFVRRSQVCQSLAPHELYLPLFERMIAALKWERASHEEFSSREKFEDGCRGLTTDVYGDSYRPAPGEELAARIPLEADVWAAVGSTISAYITRRESDSDNAAYANNEAPLSNTWSVRKSEKWKALCEAADGSIIPQLDGAVDELDGRSMLPRMKGHGQGPKDTFYRNLTKEDRYVLKVDRANNEIILLGFGDHAYPKEHGLHVD